MDGGLTPARADEVRARIAALVAPEATGPAEVGVITLQSHQRAAVARVTAAIREFGGALLADETGLGKTFVALSVARGTEWPLVVAPASLRGMWCDAARSTSTEISFVSTEALSRRPYEPLEGPDLVIVDECHHFRNPATARYRALADLTAYARVLLLSATPVHNAAQDLSALLALFLGARASTLDPAWTSRCIVRRTPQDVPTATLPRVPPAELLRVAHDEQHLDALLALPPPVPPLDGDDGGALLVYSLLRQWASTRAAMVEALRRRLARATALLAGLDTGRHPSAAELGAWSFTDGAIQLAFPEMVVDRAHQVPDAPDLAQCVRAHADAVRALLDQIDATPNPDLERAAHLAALRTRHADERIVVFSQYADSVAGMFRLLRDRPGVAALTADGGLVAGGTLTRQEVLARFAPCAQQATPPRRADAIDLLLTTDLLSEGVNLQDASVVVHLDMPWTPARLDQRVGRIARLGSTRQEVSVYAMLPPAGAERIVRVEQRLREKLGAATRAVGVAGTIIPSLIIAGPASDGDVSLGSDGRRPRSPAELSESIQAVLARWRRPPETGAGPNRAMVPMQAALDQETKAIATPHAAPARAENPACAAPEAIVGAVEAACGGFVAVLDVRDQGRILVDIGAGATDDPATVLGALRAAHGADASVTDEAVSSALLAITRWSSAHRARWELSVDGALRARARRSVVNRISAITRRAPRHLRPTIAALAASARRTVTGHFGAGAERVLGELAEASMPDEAWLRAVTTFGSIHCAVDDWDPASPTVLALLLLLPPSPAPEDPPARA